MFFVFLFAFRWHNLEFLRVLSIKKYKVLVTIQLKKPSECVTVFHSTVANIRSIDLKKVKVFETQGD